MGFGHELSLEALRKMSPSDAQDKIRAIVNRIASANVFDDYLKSQRQFFLKTLRHDDRISALFSLLPTNIFRGDDLKNINLEFSKRVGVPNKECHPFCELYNIGLLGTPKFDPISGEELQNFRKPYEFEWKHSEMIRKDRIYFLHPSLHGVVQAERNQYFVNKKVLIGDGYKWTRKTIFPLIFHSHCSLDKPWLEEFLPRFAEQMSLFCPVMSWYDEGSLKAGAPILEGVEKGIAESSIVLVYISKRSLQSKWVDKEWRTKCQKEIESGKIQVIAITIDDTTPDEIPDLLRSKKIVSLSEISNPTFNDTLIRLCGDVSHHLTNGSFFNRSRGRV